MKKNLSQALAITAFPLVLAIGIITIPVVADYSNHQYAIEAASQSGRWFWGHLISATGFGIALLAAASINRFIPEKTRLRWLVLPLMAIGAALYAFGLGADGIGPLAAASGAGGALDYFEFSGNWISGVFVTASLIFGAGLITQVACVNRCGLLKGYWRWVAFIGALVFLGGSAIPSGWGLYVVAGAAMLIYIPISLAVLRSAPSI